MAAGFKGFQGAKAGSTGFGIGVSPTLTAQQICHTVYALQGNGIDRADTAGCNGCGWRENEMYTLNTVDRPAVVIPETARTLTARHDSSPCVDRGQNVVAIDCRNLVGNEELSATLQAKNEGGFSLNFVNPICYRAGGYGEMVEGVGTLRANGGDAGGVRRASSLSMFENHSQDTRYKGPVDVSQTVSATFGMGGNNTPFVVEKHE